MPMIEFPLDLPEVRIVNLDFSGPEIVITLESTREWTLCHRCGQEIRDFHAYGDQLRLRHLPILGRPVCLKYRAKRFRCSFCENNPTTTHQPDWYEERAPHTRAYDEWLLLSLIGSTMADVMRREGLTEALVRGALNRLVARRVDWSQFRTLPILGLDEIALLKGHGNFVVLVTTRRADGTLALLAVLEDRKKETVEAFLRTIPARLRITIRDVCTDMYEGFIQAVKEVIPGARVVIDRFHVAKLYRKAADELRKEVLRDLRGSLSKEDYKTLSGTMWPFRKNPADLSAEEKDRLDLLLKAPDLKKAYDLREELTAIFNRDVDQATGRAALRGWIRRVRKSGLSCFDSFLATLEKWMDEITNYFIRRLTSAWVEGFNNKVKAIKRRCFGITNLGHLFQRLTLDLDGYRMLGR